MIVLIAPETDIQDEIHTLHQLFEAGLTHYHFRKPDKDYEAHCAYLHQIDTQYHDRIMVHYHHELLQEFDLKGIHFQEQKRRDTPQIAEYLSDFEGITVSSSFHEPEELEGCTFPFDYHLLSPVFASISKQGYEGKGFDVNHSAKKIIGMGGVTADNIPKFKALGFQGVGVLGGIWKSATPIADFKQMQGFFE
ncbi:thiamine phosphate synthase [Spongiimicrobium salis]|uniref:thiamine phosphate synthase n=1 Tax=Spongiimicrobium salis TaxID=1667022 RepID=UPI00374DB792